MFVVQKCAIVMQNAGARERERERDKEGGRERERDKETVTKEEYHFYFQLSQRTLEAIKTNPFLFVVDLKC